MRVVRRLLVPVLAVLAIAQTAALTFVIRRPTALIAPASPTAGADTPAAETPPVAPAPAPTPIAVPPQETTLSVDGTAGATVIVDGQPRGVAPVKIAGLAPGRHQVRLVTNGTAATQDVTIAAGSSTSVLFPTAISARSGWVDLRVPFPVQLFEGNRRIGASGDGPIAMSAGTHALTLRNDDFGFRYDARVTVAGGGLAVVRPVIPEGLLQMNAVPWANVFVDGEPVGDTPTGQPRVAIGRPEVRLAHPQPGQRVQNVIVFADRPARVSADLR
jgi:hypothetical protein